MPSSPVLDTAVAIPEQISCYHKPHNRYHTTYTHSLPIIIIIIIMAPAIAVKKRKKVSAAAAAAAAPGGSSSNNNSTIRQLPKRRTTAESTSSSSTSTSSLISLSELYHTVVVIASATAANNPRTAAAAAARKSHHLLATTVWPALVKQFMTQQRMQRSDGDDGETETKTNREKKTKQKRVKRAAAVTASDPTTFAKEEESSSLSFDKLSQLAAALLSAQYAEGGVSESSLDFVMDNSNINSDGEDKGGIVAAWDAWCDQIFGSGSSRAATTLSSSKRGNNNRSTDHHLDAWTVRIHCFAVAWACLSQQPAAALAAADIDENNSNNNNNRNQLFPALLRHVSGLHAFMPTRYREWYVRQQQQQQNLDTTATAAVSVQEEDDDDDDDDKVKQQPFTVTMIQHVLHLMESETLQIRPQKMASGIAAANVTTTTGQQQQRQQQRDPNNDDTAQDNDSDDLNDEENAEGVDGDYDDEGVQGTDAAAGNTDGVEPNAEQRMMLEQQQQQQQQGRSYYNNKDDDSREMMVAAASEQQDAAWRLIHRALELLSDLLSTAALGGGGGGGAAIIVSIREPMIAYLLSIHWTVRCRNAIGSSRYSTAPEHMLLAQQLLERIAKWMHGFPTTTVAVTTVTTRNKGTATAATYATTTTTTTTPVTNSVERRSVYHRRAATFQKMCHRHFGQQLPDIIYAGVGLLCTPSNANGTSYLRQALGGLSDADFTLLMHKMRLVDAHSRPETYMRSFLLAVLEEYLVVPADPLEELQSFPLYPTERVLWDFSRIPRSHSGLLSSPVLSLPKLQTRFLSFADYLWRNFELMRLESACEIRSDLTDVIRRVRPILRQALMADGEDQYMKEDAAGTVLKTEFSGWARMALEMQGHLEIKRVNKPLLGEIYPSQVLAEFTVDLGRCGDSIRREWDELGEFDNLFLVGIDARQMSGKPAPLLRDFRHLNDGGMNSKAKDSDRRVQDEDDRTFPDRFGVTLVRGCMILQIRDETGTVLSDPSSEVRPSGTKRIVRVALDPTQYSADLNSPSGTDIYNGLNLVVRRHGKVNNFRSVLETIRGLMAGMGSINRVIPTWLQSALLGHGDPKESTYQSETVKAYARATIGVANPDAYLDYGDTFLDEEHLRSSFANLATEIIVDGRSETVEVTNKPRCNYRVRVVEKDDGDASIEAKSYPFPKGVYGNPVRFTPLQVAAVRSGLSPGLSVVVGPPGTGKTDVAVQIITSLYHSFPTQRTIVITHSNAALNDIFQKVMARGDIEERYLVRLGSGERDLHTDSTHDFTKQGRVAYSLARRGVLLEEVQLLSESLGVSGRAERGIDGSPAYTCETAEYFNQHHIQKRIRIFEKEAKEAAAASDDADVTILFPFAAYWKTQDSKVSYAEAKAYFGRLADIFCELAEYRPLELLRSQRQRSDYLIMKQARVVAMTCTHAAIARSHLIKLGFEYDNVVVEEAGQMLEIESFIPLLLQRGEADSSSASSACRLKRYCLIGDHNQLPPVIQNMAFAKYSSLDQSLFARLIRLGVPYIQLDKQGRSRPEIASLYSWRYNNLGNLDRVLTSDDYSLANPGMVHTFQLINVESFEGKGETSPTSYFFQNVGEAEYAVALFQYMVLIGYSPQKISILTTYNGQKELIQDILSQRCGSGTPLSGVRPRAVSTVDQYQGQQNDIVLLSLVRTESVGHLRDVRRLVVAVSRARLGLYVLCRQELFGNCYELKRTFEQLAERPTKLQLVMGENYPTERKLKDDIPNDRLYEVDDVAHLGSIVHQMQENLINA